MRVFEPEAVRFPKSLPLVPAKSRAPSYLVALKTGVRNETLVAKLETAGPDNVSDPAMVPVIDAPVVAFRFSTLMSEVTLALLMMSMESKAPSELAVNPLPREDTTPPVTKTNFVGWEL